MGSAFEKCCQSHNEDEHTTKNKKVNLPEIRLKTSYKALSNQYLAVEEKYNFLLKINFVEYASLLINFTENTAMINQEVPKKIEINFYSDEFSAPFDVRSLQSFFENKIFKNDKLYKKVGTDEMYTTISKDLFLEIYNGLNQILKKYSHDKDNFTLRKCHALALGLIYCGGKNVDKIQFLFETFKDGDNTLNSSQDFREFLKIMFLLPSYCVTYSRYKLGDKYANKIEKLSVKDLTYIVNAFEMKDIERLVSLLIDEIFPDNIYLSLEGFYEGFKTKDIGWIFSRSGIRLYLEENNDEEGTDLKRRKENEKNVFNKLKEFANLSVQKESKSN